MQVVVRFYGLLRRAIGEREMDFPLPEGATLGDLIEEMSRRLTGNSGEKIRLYRDGKLPLFVLVNGHDQQFTGGKNTVLSENDLVEFMPPMAGG